MTTCIHLVPVVCEYGVSVSLTVWSTSASVTLWVHGLAPCPDDMSWCRTQPIGKRLRIVGGRPGADVVDGMPTCPACGMPGRHCVCSEDGP